MSYPYPDPATPIYHASFSHPVSPRPRYNIATKDECLGQRGPPGPCLSAWPGIHSKGSLLISYYWWNCQPCRKTQRDPQMQRTTVLIVCSLLSPHVDFQAFWFEVHWTMCSGQTIGTSASCKMPAASVLLGSPQQSCSTFSGAAAQH